MINDDLIGIKQSMLLNSQLTATKPPKFLIDLLQLDFLRWIKCTL